MEYYKIICWSECPFCLRDKTLLLDKGLQFEYCSIDHSRKLLDYYKKIYKQDTVPIAHYPSTKHAPIYVLNRLGIDI